MKNGFLLLVSTALLLLFTSALNAQQAITVAVINESTTIPFSSFVETPIHPGFQIGTEFAGRSKKQFRWYPAINVGYLFHEKLFQGLYANVDLGVDFDTRTGFNLKSKMGLGYLHTFTNQQEYQWNGLEYQSKRDAGNARVMPSIALGIGYHNRRRNPESPEFFLLYQSWIEYPYSPGFIPLMSHTNLHLGTKFFIK